MVKSTEKIELTTSSIFFDKEGVLRVVYKDQVEMGVPEAKLHAEACCKLCEGKKTLFLVDGRNILVHISPEARKFLANHPGLIKVRKAQAMIVDSLPNRLIANFYFKFNKPKGPGKVFNSEKSAISWLKKYE